MSASFPGEHLLFPHVLTGCACLQRPEASRRGCSLFKLARMPAWQVLALSTWTTVIAGATSAVKLAGMHSVNMPGSVVFDVLFFLTTLSSYLCIVRMHWSLIASSLPPALMNDQHRRVLAQLRRPYVLQAFAIAAVSIGCLVVTVIYSDESSEVRQHISDEAFLSQAAVLLFTTACQLSVWIFFLSRHVLRVLQQAIDTDKRASVDQAHNPVLQIRNRILTMRRWAFFNASMQVFLYVTVLVFPTDLRRAVSPYYVALMMICMSIITQIYGWHYRPPPTATAIVVPLNAVKIATATTLTSPRQMSGFGQLTTPKSNAAVAATPRIPIVPMSPAN